MSGQQSIRATMAKPITISSCRDSCTLLSQRLLAALDCPESFILHRSQWQCLANSYSLLLQDLNHVLDHAMAPSQQEPLFLKLLQALHQAMQDGERCMQDCIPRSCSHSWLVDKALMLEASTDVVHLHLHHLLWCFATILQQASRAGAHADNMESGLMQQRKVLCEIWTHADEKDDLSALRDFMGNMKGHQDGETAQLAQFLLHKLSSAEDLEGVAPDVLPEYLWVDSESLKRNPEILGLGGYGKVHEAVWLGGRFAVKDFFYVEDNVVFGREAVIQARLRHPNVMPLLCCTKNVAMHKCSLVMELMQHDLRVLMMQRLKAGIAPPFSLLVAVGLMLQIAKGMEYLHSLRIMHRDLKSSNILVSFPNGACDSYESDMCSHVHVKIADFGMSKAKMMSSMYTTKPAGTTIWRAPEVFEISPEDEMDAGTTARYTNKADVYSFGLVCYEILTGKSPFEGGYVRKRVMGGERPTLPPYSPRALSSYIERCWHADPAVRPPFTQICRMLCYFKACIFLQGEHVEMDWLSRPISPSMCDHIDAMIQKSVRPLGTHIQPKLLSIPLEMYCCQLVLHERDGVENCSEDDGESTSTSPRTQRTAVKMMEKAPLLHPGLRVENCSEDDGESTSTRHSRSGLRYKLGLVGDFSFKELRQATSNFSNEIGSGLIGKVYYGKLADGREIAVKAAAHRDVLQNASDDYDSGLTQELRITSQLRHRNIVPLLGWCQVQSNLLLVYEYMPNGSLASHIFDEDNKVLFGWQQRHKAIIDLASALKYLHQDSGPTPIVHRDVKVSTVLVDSEWNARLGSCGLALSLKNGDHILAGTFGNIAPESATHGICSPATDVYSFGVTVLEIACGRSHYKHYAYSGVRKWVWDWYQSGDFKELENDVNEVEMKRLLLLGLSCTNLDPHMRPTIDEVLRVLAGVSKPPPIAYTMYPYTSSERDWPTVAESF